MLDLDARVHLDEDVVPVAVEQEFHGARVAVADLLGEPHGVGADPLAQLRVEVRRRGEFDHLLVPALHRAVALEEVDDIAVPVGEDLHLDVAGVDDGLLQEDRGVAERGSGLAGRRLDGVTQRVGVLDTAHTASSAAGDRLDEHGKADVLGGTNQLVHVGGGLRGTQHRYARRARRSHRAGLVPGQFQDVRARPDERDARLLARPRELGVLGQEPIARVHRIRPRPARGTDDLLHREIGPHGVPRLADLMCLVGLQPVQ